MYNNFQRFTYYPNYVKIFNAAIMSAELGEDMKSDVSETHLQEDTDKSSEDINEDDSTLKSAKNELEDEWVDILGSGQLRKRVCCFTFIKLFIFADESM